MNSEDTSLYSALGIDPTQTDVLSLSERDITRAYRKAALKHHPDKNRSDPSAAEKFSAIFLAYETLQSPGERSKYDGAIRAARLQLQRFEKLDANRKKFKSDLDRREKEAAGGMRNRKRNLNEETLKRMEREIERLRREAMREGGEGDRVENRSEQKKERKEEKGGGVWASVHGFSEFRSGRASERDFNAFEEAVLAGRSWTRS